jgi:hypothetical protein
MISPPQSTFHTYIIFLQIGLTQQASIQNNGHVPVESDLQTEANMIKVNPMRIYCACITFSGEFDDDHHIHSYFIVV